MSEHLSLSRLGALCRVVRFDELLEQQLDLRDVVCQAVHQDPMS
eukprot:COSAG06_NODE_22982_length_706_cov_1.243822_1_plen_43_part_10